MPTSDSSQRTYLFRCTSLMCFPQTLYLQEMLNNQSLSGANNWKCPYKDVYHVPTTFRSEWQDDSETAGICSATHRRPRLRVQYMYTISSSCHRPTLIAWLKPHRLVPADNSHVMRTEMTHQSVTVMSILTMGPTQLFFKTRLSSTNFPATEYDGLVLTKFYICIYFVIFLCLFG